MYQLTNEKVINRFISIWGNKYDYSEVKYEKFNIEIKVYCNIHKEFFYTKPNQHLKYGCPICSGFKDTKQSFINKCNKKWDNKYNYTNTIYNKSHDIIEYECLEHGLIKQKAYNHLNHGCPKCSRIKINKDTFIKKSNIIHNNKYDYSLIKKVNGINDYVDIICIEHGVFNQNINTHLKGHKCIKCYHDSMKMTLNTFIEKSKLIHNNKYDYSKSIYIDYTSNIEIICPNHGSFLQMVKIHIKGSGCPRCNDSKGEKKISKYLISNNINFIRNKKYNYCKNHNLLPFDFYLIDKNILIEYDGELHYKCIEKFGGEEKIRLYKINDDIKTNYCLSNNIKLLRIPYWEYENIENILINKIK